jgi:hypothetical protein
VARGDPAEGGAPGGAAGFARGRRGARYRGRRGARARVGALDEIDGAPVREVRDREAREALEDGLRIERSGELLARVGEEHQLLVRLRASGVLMRLIRIGGVGGRAVDGHDGRSGPAW